MHHREMSLAVMNAGCRRVWPVAIAVATVMTTNATNCRASRRRGHQLVFVLHA